MLNGDLCLIVLGVLFKTLGFQCNLKVYGQCGRKGGREGEGKREGGREAGRKEQMSE